MHPLMFQGTAFELSSYTLMTLVALAAGLAWIGYEGARRGDGDRYLGLAFEAFLVGLISTRVFYVVQNWSRLYAHEPWVEILRPGGLVWYAGPLVALPYTIWRAHRSKLRVFDITDVFVQGLVLGHGIGRVGCFLHGCCFGTVCVQEAWYTATITGARTGLPRALLGRPLLPIQLLETLSCLAIFAVLLAYRRRLAATPGAITALYFALYAVARFVLEFFRADEERGFLARGLPLLGDFSTSQAISVAVVIPAGALFARLCKRQALSPAIPQEAPARAP